MGEVNGLAVGSTAPEFRAPATTGEEISLSELLAAGPAVVAFYTFAFTGNEEKG